MGDKSSTIHEAWKSFIASEVELEVYLGMGIHIFETEIIYLWLLKANFRADHLKMMVPILFFYMWVIDPVPFTKRRSPL